MKKILLMLLCACLLLTAGCGDKEGESGTAVTDPQLQTATDAATEAATEPPVTEPPVTEPPAPKTIQGTILADHTVVIQTMLNRGDVVALAGEFDENHYVVQTDAGYGLIEKNLVRPESEAAYEQWQGFARYGAKFYDNYHMLAVNSRDLASNTQIQVLDMLGDILVVELDGVTGYMYEAHVSRTRIQYGGGGGEGADGGDIVLGGAGNGQLLSVFVPQSGTVSGNAVVLADRAEVIVGWYDRNEVAEIVMEAGYGDDLEGFWTVYANGMCGYVRINLMNQQAAGSYSEWDGFARAQAGLYDNYYLAGEPTKLATNTQIRVLCDLGNCYLVEADGVMGYMDMLQISEHRIVYSGGGGGEWSDPVM